MNTKIQCIIVPAPEVDEETLNNYKLKECLAIDNFENNIDEKILYSVINMAHQDNKYLIISSPTAVKMNIKLNDLIKIKSFIDIGIDLPTDDLLRVILTKTFLINKLK